MTQNLEMSVFTIAQWVYFTYNFRDAKSICNDIWSDNPTLAAHIYGKLVSYEMDFNRLFCELDRENQARLAAWVIENYHGIDSRRPK